MMKLSASYKKGDSFASKMQNAMIKNAMIKNASFFTGHSFAKANQSAMIVANEFISQI